MVDGRRLYRTPAGVWYPSITTVLSILSEDGIAQWKESVGDEEAARVTEHACERGTALHSAIEDYLSNREPKFPDDRQSLVKMMFKRMRPKLDRIDNVIAQEIPLYSDRLKVAGRCDCIAEYDGVLSIIDFKSASKAKRKEYIQGYFQQGTAYSLMLEEKTGISVRQIVILMCGEIDFSTQVFIERRKSHILPLVSTVESFASRKLFG
jgi:ATP-dependent exoDNAse (exonuclease V) beta subunit